MIFAALALAAASPANLAPLQFLVGRCWRTTLKEGPTDTHCFSRSQDGERILDRHAVRKDGTVIYSGESVFSVVSGVMHYMYDGDTNVHLEGPMHVADDRIIFDDTDKTGTVTFWRQVDSSHYEDVTEVTPSAPPELAKAGERKVFELVPGEKP